MSIRLCLPVLASLAVSSADAAAETLKQAILRALVGNPSINAQRASLRATKEKLPQARSGYFPKVYATANFGFDELTTRFPATAGAWTSTTSQTHPKGAGLQMSLNLFDGWRTPNSVSQSKQLIESSAENLRAQEQQTIVDAASAYLNVLRASELQDIYKDNAGFIAEQYRVIAARHAFGDVTRSDLALAQARLAIARSQHIAASASLAQSRAIYQQTIGDEPANLVPPAPIDRVVAMDLDAALRLANQQHPAIKAALSAALLQVKIARGEFAPQIGLAASLGKQFDTQTRGDTQLTGTIRGQVTVPLFDGGLISSKSREASQIAAQRQLEADAVQAQVRAAVMTGWNQLATGKAQVASAQMQVAAAQNARASMGEEYRFGQRTLLDVLNSQQDLLTARSNLAFAEHDRVLASFALAQATGLLTLTNVVSALDKSVAPRASALIVGRDFPLRRTLDEKLFVRGNAAVKYPTPLADKTQNWLLRTY